MFHIPLKIYFPEQDLLQDEKQPKRLLDFPAWDLDLVLKRLELENNSSFDNLLEKTLFLTILAFTARIS